MLFSSEFFIFGFLPCCLFFYLLAKSLRLKNIILIAFSSFFFIWGDPSFFIMVLVGTAFDYLLIKHVMNNPAINLNFKRIHILSLAVCINLFLLIVFKYGNFIVEQIDPALLFFGFSSSNYDEIILPLGISFVTFHRISLLVDCYRDTSQTPKSFLDTFLYIIIFPHMIAGPIVQYAEISRFFYVRTHRYRRFVVGIALFSLGLAKKVLIADPIGAIADSTFDGPILDVPTHVVWISVLAYTMQIYFDFSGYSDMAIGLARMFGVRFPKNFNQPYTATSITDFWRRWHITLSRWMGRYLYLPIGGNQMSPSRNFLNLWIVFVVSGFWHGAAWNFLLWGCFHGFFISMDKYLKTLQLAVKIHWSAKQMITFFIVFNSWVLFRANNVTEAFQVYKRMYINFDSSFHNPFWLVFTPHQITVFLFAISIAIVPWRRVNLAYNLGIQFYRMTNLSLCLSLVLILICTSFIFANNTDNFLYFRF